MGIFNRSYYEEVLVVRVHPEILHQQSLPAELLDETTIWQERFTSIINFEDHLHRTGTRIVKIFLHLSKKEQRQRFLSRIDEPEKNWKFSTADLHERGFWPQYMAAYEDCLNTTSTSNSPWHAVPADDKKNARLIVSQILVNTFQGMHMEYPRVSEERRRELEEIRHKV